METWAFIKPYQHNRYQEDVLVWIIMWFKLKYMPSVSNLCEIAETTKEKKIKKERQINEKRKSINNMTRRHRLCE